MVIFIALGIALVAVAFVAAPLFLGTGREPGGQPGREQMSLELQDLLAEKETIYAAIQELDFDLASGKLSPDDHQGLRQRHEERAAILLKTIDELQATTGRPEGPRKARREKRRR